MKHEEVEPSAPELPEGRPQPNAANPGGTEGTDSAWTGGQSNLGEVINPAPDADTTYSTRDLPDVARRESVRAFLCGQCGARFPTEANLNLHRRTAHRPR